MSTLQKLTQLNATLDDAIELARGDRAIKALKKAGEMPPAGEGFIAAMRKNAKQYRRQYNAWMGDNLTPSEAVGQMNAVRKSAAKQVRAVTGRTWSNYVSKNRDKVARME